MRVGGAGDVEGAGGVGRAGTDAKIKERCEWKESMRLDEVPLMTYMTQEKGVHGLLIDD